MNAKMREIDRAGRLARLRSRANEVWQHEAFVERFMVTAHPELDGETPIEAAGTEAGGRRVEHILNALAYGLPV